MTYNIILKPNFNLNISLEVQNSIIYNCHEIRVEMQKLVLQYVNNILQGDLVI